MKPLRLKLLIPIISAVLLSACGADSPSGLTPTLTRLPRTATTQPTRTATPTVVATATQTPRPTATELGNWIEPIASQPPLSRATTSADERASFAELERINPPALNEPALAAALGRDIPLGASRVPISYTVGYSDTFIIPAIATGEIIEHELVLARISDQAYFWFDPSYELDPAAMDEVTSGFEILFTAVQNFFGPTRQAGLDGDRRVHIVNVSGETFCGAGVRACGAVGYYLPSNTLPRELYPSSNEREMLVMNIDRDLRGSLYFGILAHELRHLIEFQYDQHEADWEIEGTATLAQLLASDTQGPSQLQNSYLANPDVQLNGWTTDGSGSYYGVGYLFSRYILERMGLDFFSTWVRSPQPGFFGIEDALIKTNTDLSPLKIWQDFGIAIALLDEVAPAPYSFSDNFDGGPVDRQVVGAFPANLLVDVKQYAFQFYEIRQQGTYTANFVGTTKVAALQGVLPASGHKMWWGGRANYSDVFLSREFDLSEVDKATFNYSIYHHIQSGFDSAHLLISTDGGQSWTELIAPAMMSAEGEAIFGHIPLTEHFYSGQSLGWLSESVDLSEYAGQVIQLRFQYFTDALITDPGIALDNLSIPEIGFYDDAELSNAGWQQQGFTRVSAYLPQRFQVSLITFDRTGLPIVEHIELDDLNAANFEFTISAASRAFLVIGGSTPTTLSPARFSLTLAKTP